MSLMREGGWMMWPLLAVSIAALAIIVERSLALLGFGFPDRKFDALLLQATSTGNIQELAAAMGRYRRLAAFSRAMTDPDIPEAARENTLRLAGEMVVSRLEAHLPLLSILARLAPLMGLLGTILGMITTFAHIANASSGVDMTLLSEGIKQALLTTATGLFIAIPSLFFLYFFQGKARKVADALSQAGNLAVSAQGGTRHD